jgi:hypothetical protein
MTYVYFTVAAIGLYFLADRVLDGIERRLGRRIEHRSLVFFALLLGFALVAFEIIGRLAGE